MTDSKYPGLLERFIKYAKVETRSDDQSKRYRLALRKRPF